MAQTLMFAALALLPTPPDPGDEIASLLESGAEVVVLQFSEQAAYDETVLGKVNLICERFGSRLNVRFYGHYG